MRNFTVWDILNRKIGIEIESTEQAKLLWEHAYNLSSKGDILEYANDEDYEKYFQTYLKAAETYLHMGSRVCVSFEGHESFVIPELIFEMCDIDNIFENYTLYSIRQLQFTSPTNNEYCTSNDYTLQNYITSNDDNSENEEDNFICYNEKLTVWDILNKKIGVEVTNLEQTKSLIDYCNSIKPEDSKLINLEFSTTEYSVKNCLNEGRRVCFLFEGLPDSIYCYKIEENEDRSSLDDLKAKDPELYGDMDVPFFNEVRILPYEQLNLNPDQLEIKKNTISLRLKDVANRKIGFEITEEEESQKLCDYCYMISKLNYKMDAHSELMYEKFIRDFKKLVTECMNISVRCCAIIEGENNFFYPTLVPEKYSEELDNVLKGKINYNSVLHNSAFPNLEVYNFDQFTFDYGLDDFTSYSSNNYTSYDNSYGYQEHDTVLDSELETNLVSEPEPQTESLSNIDLSHEQVLENENKTLKSEKNVKKKIKTKKLNSQYLTVLLLTIFLGPLGIQHAINGRLGAFIIRFLTFGLCYILVLFDLILIISGNFKDKNGNPIKRKIDIDKKSDDII